MDNDITLKQGIKLGIGIGIGLIIDFLGLCVVSAFLVGLLGLT